METDASSTQSNQTEVKIENDENETTATAAIARERFLRLLLSFENKECEFRMYENTVVKGVYQGSDVAFENVGVSGLKTPIAVYESASLRTSDILTMTFNLEMDKWCYLDLKKNKGEMVPRFGGIRLVNLIKMCSHYLSMTGRSLVLKRNGITMLDSYV